MEPIPETSEAIEEFRALVVGEGEDVLDQLLYSAALVRVIVPSCVGLSLGVIEHGVTFTLQATSAEIASLDGLQYVDDGPCVAAALEARPTTFETTSPTDEARWSLFARACAARGVASTLTLPITSRGRVHGSINLYASTPHAFDDHHTELAAIFGAWAEGAVTDADLPFATRRLAQRAPQDLRDQALVSQAVGVLASARDVDMDTAADILRRAADRAGTTLVAVARRVLEAFGHPSD